MALHALDHRLQRILRVRADLHAVDQRVRDADNAREAAVHAFERARAVMEDASDEATRLHSRQQEIRAELHALRQSFICDSVASLPADMLRCIFEEVVALPQGTAESALSSLYYQEEHALAPFRLAAVCQRWRSLAVGQPRLWTYISAPDNMDTRRADLHLQRIRLLVRRSRHMPLDVFLRFRMKTSPHCWADCPPLEEIISLVADHASRWRTFELSLPQKGGGRGHISALRGPLPLLERFCLNISGRGLVIEASIQGCLPFAPLLQDLVIWAPGAVTPVPRPLLPALKRLSLWSPSSFHTVWPLMSASASTLESLIIGGDLEDPNALTAVSGVVFPRLKSLVIDDVEDGTLFCLSNVRMPHLEELTLGKGTIDAFSSLLHHTSSSVRCLSLMRDITRSDVNILQLLSNIHTLRFTGMLQLCHPKLTYSVSDDFFAAIPDNVWPKLVSVEFHPTGKFELGDGAGTLAFIRSRTGPIQQTDGMTAAARLEEFDTPDDLPYWFVDEVDRLLSDE